MHWDGMRAARSVTLSDRLGPEPIDAPMSCQGAIHRRARRGRTGMSHSVRACSYEAVVPARGRG
jgi:hypothetical protein